MYNIFGSQVSSIVNWIEMEHPSYQYSISTSILALAYVSPMATCKKNYGYLQKKLREK